MDLTNTNRVCEMIGGYQNCKYCPLLKKCESNPKDPDHPADWEERMEKAATDLLDKVDRLVAILQAAPSIDTPNSTDEEWRQVALYLLWRGVAPPLVIKRKENKA